MDMDGEKAAVCYKEIATALRQWVLPAFVSAHTSNPHIPADVLQRVFKVPSPQTKRESCSSCVVALKDWSQSDQHFVHGRAE